MRFSILLPLLATAELGADEDAAVVGLVLFASSACAE